MSVITSNPKVQQFLTAFDAKFTETRVVSAYAMQLMLIGLAAYLFAGNIFPGMVGGLIKIIAAVVICIGSFKLTPRSKE